MSYGIVCRQHGCRQWAEYRFTWPGRDKSFICEEHANRVRIISSAMGVHVQLIPLTPLDHEGLEGMKSLKDQGKE